MISSNTDEQDDQFDIYNFQSTVHRKDCIYDLQFSKFVPSDVHLIHREQEGSEYLNRARY